MGRLQFSTEMDHQAGELRAGLVNLILSVVGEIDFWLVSCEVNYIPSLFDYLVILYNNKVSES